MNSKMQTDRISFKWMIFDGNKRILTFHPTDTTYRFVLFLCCLNRLVAIDKHSGRPLLQATLIAFTWLYLRKEHKNDWQMSNKMQYLKLRWTKMMLTGQCVSQERFHSYYVPQSTHIVIWLACVGISRQEIYSKYISTGVTLLFLMLM